MPKILFIQPTQYGADNKLCKQKKIYLPGLAFPLLAAMTPSHWEVELKLEVVDDIDFESDADIVGIGTMGYAIYRGIEIAKEFRKRGKTVVMGGYMASMVVKRALEFVDSVVVGDAEKSYLQMLSDFEKTGKLKAIYDHPIDDLDALPLPRYELLTEKALGNMLPVQAGRGCPLTCSFCSIACLYQGKYVFRPVDEVIRDIKEIKKLGFKKFYLLDDNLVSNPKYLMELCEKIKPLKMTWASQCSLHLAKKPALLRAVREAGCNLLSFGIESITQEGLDKLGKSWLKVDEHSRHIQTLTKAGIMVSSEMIIGTDSDTEQSIRATYDFIMENKLPIPRFYILTPIPGSELYEEYKKEGRLITDDLEKFDGSQCVHKPEKLSPEQTTELFWWLYKKVFSVKNILVRTLFNPYFIKAPSMYFFAFIVNLHYRRYVQKRVPPNIF
jgi:radical SAM superfamily enzyme YgiQ (UPF0313 family)